ncbi:MAG: SRPBCC domain-containing protein, partial [Gillisia sp.]|nr:SRPBCC domain-containing protein [Gillisia sp.]
MGTTTKKSITVEATINAPVKKVWGFWTDPKHIIHWNQASHNWHTPKAENDLSVGGKFLLRMEARDGNSGFDFSGIYDEIKTHK